MLRPCESRLIVRECFPLDRSIKHLRETSEKVKAQYRGSIAWTDRTQTARVLGGRAIALQNSIIRPLPSWWVPVLAVDGNRGTLPLFGGEVGAKPVGERLKPVRPHQSKQSRIRIMAGHAVGQFRKSTQEILLHMPENPHTDRRIAAARRAQGRIVIRSQNL